MIMSHMVHQWAVLPVLNVDGQFSTNGPSGSLAGQKHLLVVVVMVMHIEMMMHIEKAVGGVGDVVVVGDWHGDVVGDGDLREGRGYTLF